MGKDKCKCSMSISVLGDGCRYCNPQFYIDLLEEQLAEAQEENIFDLMDDHCDVVITRAAMSDRVGVIQYVKFINGEIYVGLHSGGMYPLVSVEVKRKEPSNG